MGVLGKADWRRRKGKRSHGDGVTTIPRRKEKMARRRTIWASPPRSMPARFLWLYINLCLLDSFSFQFLLPFYESIIELGKFALSPAPEPSVPDFENLDMDPYIFLIPIWSFYSCNNYKTKKFSWRVHLGLIFIV